ncbi:hypothetical protein [Methyloceanibacter sp.]|uniref:hypothetical protein n=1 Tax=Methyloceanibacter sp. TaxID=1965321 RepID=UPI003D6D2597
MIDAALVIWFILTGLSVAYVAWDAFTRNPELTVMKYGWVLVTGPQLAAVTFLTLLALGAGTVLAGLSGGLGMGKPRESMSRPHPGADERQGNTR